jgi:hypothetical protein
VRYQPAALDPPQRSCQPGTRALALAVGSAFPELQTLSGAYGCFNRRRISGSAQWSLHAEGRAFDVGVRAALNAVGWELACELVAQRLLYGTMRVMWDRHIWSTERPDQWRRLSSSAQPHTDHVHVEQFRAAAARPLAMRDDYERALIRSRAD